MRLNLVLSAILAFSIYTNDAEAAQPARVCRSIAAMLRADRQHGASYTDGISPLIAIARHSHGRLIYPKWHDISEERAAILHANPAPEGPGTGVNPQMTSVQGGQLSGVMTSGGNANCLAMTFFRSINHRLVKIATPFVAEIMTCARWGNFIQMGTLDGTPFVARVSDLNRRVDIVPWNGNGWNHTCSLEITYVRHLISQQPFCRSDRCGDVEAIVERLVQTRIAAGPELPTLPEDDPELMHMMHLARSSPETKNFLTKEDVLPYAWLEIVTPVRVNNRPTLVVVGEWHSGPNPETVLLGYRATVWQQDGDDLVAMAGFQYQVDRSVLRSVYVSP